MLKHTTPNKTKIAKKLGVSRQSLYYIPTKDQSDQKDIELIKEIMSKHPAYGHKRIAMELKWGKNKVLRLMRKFNLKPARRRIQRPPIKPGDYRRTQVNDTNIHSLYPFLNQIDETGILWRSDFTYLKINDMFYYQATVIEVANREIVGLAISDRHDAGLICQALKNALAKYPPPLFLHSDQGSEYCSSLHRALCEKYQIVISMSDKSSPWQNSHQESFYSHFKLEFGDFSRFDNLGELIANIHDQVYYYNHQRIHTALKMPPIAYRNRLLTINKNRQTV